jgi:hypothetical protein
MGDVPENEKNWNKLALAKGYKCSICGERIPFSEREIYFDRKICGHCAYKEDKHD